MAREIEDNDSGSGKMLQHILRTLFAIVALGLGILVGLVAVLRGNDVRPDAVFWLAVIYLATIFGICFTLMRQVPKLIDARLKRWDNTTDASSPDQLASHTTAQLEEFREPVMSVTDHTTKTLDKVPFTQR